MICLFALYFVFRNNDEVAVKIEFGELDKLSQGKPFDLEVSILSEESKILKNAKLAVFLPPGVFFVGDDEDQRVKEKNLGDVGPGSLNKETFSLIAIGEAGEKKAIETKLIYTIAPNDKVVFEVEKGFEIELGDSVIGLTLETPEEAASEEIFEMKVKYKNESDEDLENLILRIDYPPVYKFREASVKPDKGENIWEILFLGKGEEREFTVTGNVTGFLGTSFEIPVLILGEFNGQEYTLRVEKKVIKISEAPLSVLIEAQGSSGLKNSEGGYVARRGEKFRYIFKYKNNSNVALNNVELKAKFSGEAFDLSAFHSTGNFNSYSRTIFWNSGNTPEFSSLAPGATGILEVEVGVRSDIIVNRLSDKNYLLKVESEIKSSNSPSGSVGLLSLSKNETKMAGEAVVDARAFYRDAASGILNEGDFPPRVGAATQFTVRWVLKNYYNELSGAEFSARLPSGVKWTGKTKSNSTNQPVYDSTDNLVKWKIDRVIATKGVISEPYEAIFQVEVTPSSGQVGQVLEVLGPTDFVAHDDFADVTIMASDVKVDTNLPDDTTVQGVIKTVQP